MAITKNRLYSERAVVAIRGARTAADAPATGDWTPDNLNASEDGPDEVILDAQEWQSVRVIADFRDGSGDPVDGGSVDITPLIATYDPTGTEGRRWKELTAVSGLAGVATSEVAVDGHLFAVRIDAVTLGSATDVVIKVTGGVYLSH